MTQKTLLIYALFFTSYLFSCARTDLHSHSFDLIEKQAHLQQQLIEQLTNCVQVKENKQILAYQLLITNKITRAIFYAFSSQLKTRIARFRALQRATVFDLNHNQGQLVRFKESSHAHTTPILSKASRREFQMRNRHLTVHIRNALHMIHHDQKHIRYMQSQLPITKNVQFQSN